MNQFLSDRIADLGRKELQQIVNDQALHEIHDAVALDWKVDESVVLDKTAASNLRTVLQWLAAHNADYAAKLVRTLDDRETSPKEAILAVELDISSLSPVLVSVSSLFMFLIHTWFRVWKTKLALKYPAETEWRLIRVKDELRLVSKQSGLQGASLPANEFLDKLKSNADIKAMLDGILSEDDK